MRVFNGISIQLDPLVEKSKLWMVSQGNAQNQRVIQEGLLQLYVQINVELYTKLGSALHCLHFDLNATNKAFMPSCAIPETTSTKSTTSMLTSNRSSRGSWHGRGRGGRGHGSRCAVYEAETTDTSKPIVDATNSEVDVIKMLQAYGMVPTDGSELKHKRMKKVATDEISVVQDLDNDFTFEPKPLVLHGSLVECNIDVQWETCDRHFVNIYIHH